MANFFKDYEIKVKAKQALDCKFNPAEILNSVVNNKGNIDRSFPTGEAKAEQANWKLSSNDRKNTRRWQ